PVQPQQGAQAIGPLRTLLSFEPYALALAHGDDEFRLAVDRTLSGLCRDGGMQRIFQATFGKAQPSQLLQALFSINALPE
ncbi:MAG: hypothetical protein ACREE7_02875, partial [Dongiaceae bacterium]